MRTEFFPSGLNLEDRLSAARAQLARVSADAYLEELVGTIGADPFSLQIPCQPDALD